MSESPDMGTRILVFTGQGRDWFQKTGNRKLGGDKGEIQILSTAAEKAPPPVG